MLMHTCIYVLTPLLKILASQSGNDNSYSRLRLRPFTQIILVTPLDEGRKIGEFISLKKLFEKIHIIIIIMRLTGPQVERKW